MTDVDERMVHCSEAKPRLPALLALTTPGLGAGLGAPAMWGRVDLGARALEGASAHPSLVWFGSEEGLLVVTAAIILVALVIRAAQSLAEARACRSSRQAAGARPRRASANGKAPSPRAKRELRGGWAPRLSA